MITEQEYEEKDDYYVWSYPFRATRSEEAEIERHFQSQPEQMQLDQLRSRLEWAERNGTEDRCAELTGEIRILLNLMFDKAKEWFATRIPDGI